MTLQLGLLVVVDSYFRFFNGGGETGLPASSDSFITSGES